MTETEARGAVVAEAMSWLRTPYHPEARLKGVGVDCATLLAEVYERAGVLPRIEIEHYPPDWHLHKRAERYLNTVLRYARPIAGPPLPGDVALGRFGQAFAHGAIVVEPGWPAILHASMEDRMVCLAEGAGGRLASAAVRFFTLWS